MVWLVDAAPLCCRSSSAAKVFSSLTSSTVGDGGGDEVSEDEDEKVSTQLLGLLATELQANEVKYSFRERSNKR